jgi:hypothetical protein
MKYVRCINNEGYLVSLRLGAIYRVLPPEPNDGDLLRIADETSGEPGSAGGYLFAATRFEPVDLAELDADATSTVTVHLSPTLRAVLRAEALAAEKSVSALMRAWIDEHLDLSEEVNHESNHTNA